MTTPTPQVTDRFLTKEHRQKLADFLTRIEEKRYAPDVEILEAIEALDSWIAELLTERDTLWQERVDDLEAQIIRLKSDIAHAIGFCRGIGHPEKYLEKYYPTLIPDQKEKRETP